MNKNYFRIRKNHVSNYRKYNLYIHTDEHIVNQLIGWADNSDSGCFKLSENVTTVYLWHAYRELYEALFKT